MRWESVFQSERKKSIFDRLLIFARDGTGKAEALVRGKSQKQIKLKEIFTMENTKNTTKKLVIAAMLIAIGVIGGAWSIPVGASKCAPIQHMINILCATVLGPWYGVAAAFIISLLRNLMGTGTLLAFPGSMCGALLSGILCMLFKKFTVPVVDKVLGKGTLGAIIGELFGTAVLGGILSYPIAVFMLGKEAAVYTYIFPFFVSTLGGTIIGTVLYAALRKTGALNKLF